MRTSPIYLSPPHQTDLEAHFVEDALSSNWITSVGKHLDAFELELAQYLHSAYCVALSSGTAALHLALIEAGVGVGDVVLVSNFTFCASVNPILYVGATPVFLGSESDSWNLDPNLLEDALKRFKPKALVLVHLYGQAANLNPILSLCDKYGVLVIEDAAEAVGATYQRRFLGTFGRFGILSFNGNKLITTSAGGAVLCESEQEAHHIKKLATQARESVIHYEHKEIGYNYRLSNVLAAFGRGQLMDVENKIAARQANFSFYKNHLTRFGVYPMPNPDWGRSTHWLSCFIFDEQELGVSAQRIQLALSEHKIESRPLWKPMHLQPVYGQYPVMTHGIEEQLFKSGLCLPSGSNLTDIEKEDIVTIMKTVLQNG